MTVNYTASGKPLTRLLVVRIYSKTTGANRIELCDSIQEIRTVKVVRR